MLGRAIPPLQTYSCVYAHSRADHQARTLGHRRAQLCTEFIAPHFLTHTLFHVATCTAPSAAEIIYVAKAAGAEMIGKL